MHIRDVSRPKLIGVKKKLDRREAVRERKALSAAKLERSIEAELIERLKSKAYGDMPLNVNEAVWQAVLDRERGVEKESEKGKGRELDLVDDETDEEDEEEMEDEEKGWGEREFVSDLSGEEDELSDLEDVVVSALFVDACGDSRLTRAGSRAKRTKRATRMKTMMGPTRTMRFRRRRPLLANGKHLQNRRSRQGRAQRRRRDVSPLSFSYNCAFHQPIT